ncbi:MAG TPA: N-acetylglucosamine kinase [Bacteroidia bacterium]|nr:N-acetylglucosamine kinase [Bacteroidia bacterium]
MILVADSGSTKTDWIAQSAGLETIYQTVGFNPFFHDFDFVLKELKASSDLVSIQKEITQVFFFGAGCSSPERIEHIKKPLAAFFSNATVIVEHDMLGCALSVCEGKPGVACILGTGSNTCYFDGNEIAHVRHGLGYVLGDEGSGSYFGKKILTAYLYQILPPGLNEAFGNSYRVTKEIALQQVYKENHPNTYLASFAPFYSEFSSHPFIIELIKKGFREFYETNVMSYAESKSVPVHFTGSIAWVFRDILKEVSDEFEIKIGTVIRKPVNGLAAYFFSGGKMPGVR